MNALQNRMQDGQHMLEADLAARVAVLFQRFPELCGFTVQQGGGLTRERAAQHLAEDLFLVDFACHPALDAAQAEALCELVWRMLNELMEEQPLAMELIRGRTFARALH